jgi:hypothetical protein
MVPFYIITGSLVSHLLLEIGQSFRYTIIHCRFRCFQNKEPNGVTRIISITECVDDRVE